MFSFFNKKQPNNPPIKYVDLNELNGRLFNDMGLDWTKMGDPEKAIFYFSKAIELQPSLAEYIVNRAIVYWNYESPNLALLDLDLALNIGSDRALQLRRKFEQEYDIQLQSKARYIKLLNEAKVDYLYHMTHLDNLKGIFEHGLLSHNRAHQNGILSKDISDRTVNNRRVKFHDYVPLYFNPKNPMLYRIKDIQDEIAILCINREVLFSEKVLIADGNAASSTTSFYKSVGALKKLDWNIIRSEYWSDFVDGKRIRCAETLLPDEIATTQIEQIFCYSNISMKKANEQLHNYEIPITVSSKLFF